jgi:hypothetical protein
MAEDTQEGPHSARPEFEEANAERRRAWPRRPLATTAVRNGTAGDSEMDFEDTPEEAAFRAEARAFLEANAERRKPGAVEGYRRGQDAPGAMERAKSFQRRKAEAGFVGIHWPKEWGGRGGTQIQNVIYNQEEAQFDVLSGIFGIGIGLAMPTICTCGTPEQRDRFVSRRCAPNSCGASCSRNRRAVPILPRCARVPNVTATSGWSTVRRSGTPARTTAISASWSRAAIRMCRSTPG